MCKRRNDQIGMLGHINQINQTIVNERISPLETRTRDMLSPQPTRNMLTSLETRDMRFLDDGPRTGMTAFSTLSVRTGPSDYFTNDCDVINIQLKVGNEHNFILKDLPNLNEVSTLGPTLSPKFSRTKINYWTPYVRLPCQQNLTWKNSNKFRGLWGTVIKRV